ncbi:hypothetical protein HYX08_00340 [Candidatus Woesearchaeota archaeon]|nr:hypothetical protein [Candidatus Woesearchaeota archaeon]
MKKLAVLLLLFFILPSSFAEWYQDSGNIVTGIDISSSAEIVQTSSSGYIDSAAVNMTFFPKQTETQELLKLKTEPLADFTGDSLKFKWNMPQGAISFRINANVKTINTIPQVRQKISFPINDLPKEIVVYTMPSETIDSNDEAIVKIASELAKGEDDLYAAVFKIADWTKNNINYNLSTLTADVSQKASWVLENRQGVCDELTSLFIALLRAVGIPARFVSGLSYTESELFPEKWGPHGWAEVYFPDYGWVPFDVTYGEFGWVDPTHIKFKDSVDSDEPSTYYSWIGRNADLKTNKLDINAELIEKTGYYKAPLNLESSSLKQSVGFGSYNLLEADVENLNDFYFATELKLSRPKEVSVTGPEAKSILLLPRERKKVFWTLKISDDLDSRYSYTFPLVVSASNGIKSETSFASGARERFVSFSEIKQAADLFEEEKEKKYSGNVLLGCSIPKPEFYGYEDVNVYCTAKNTGNIYLEGIDVCFEGKCEKMSLGISQSKNVTFGIKKTEFGFREVPVTLRSDLVSKASYVAFKINDAPEISIKELEFPANAGYGENFTVSFILAKESFSNPKNVEVIFARGGFEKKWSMNELAENRKFVLDFAGRQLKYGKNNYKISVNYFDGLGKKYSANREFSIDLTDATMPQRALLWFNNLEQSLETVVIMISIVGIVFLILIGWVWRKRRY